jgi:hypothetical protein
VTALGECLDHLADAHGLAVSSDDVDERAGDGLAALASSFTPAALGPCDCGNRTGRSMRDVMPGDGGNLAANHGQFLLEGLFASLQLSKNVFALCDELTQLGERQTQMWLPLASLRHSGVLLVCNRATVRRSTA